MDDTESNKRERELFLEASDLEGDVERAAFLAQACAGDVELRARIELLLRNQGQTAPGFLAIDDSEGGTPEKMIECPDCRTSYPAGTLGGKCPRCVLEKVFGEGEIGDALKLAGSRIGRYLLIEQIGVGGMGSVWRAKQEDPIEREVALKLIKPGMDTRAIVSRFEAERQVLAVLDHPHIAKIHDAGATAEGRPYYVMELAEGLPVTEYCQRNHLSTDDRLALFGQICKGVQHAHERGIVHRDLKPSNILVADHTENRIKIIDFGVAKAAGPSFAEQTIVTLDGEIVGTPGYMSPEQADGARDIDGRADVYSLGALLYELLSNTPPFTNESLRNAGLLEVIRMIKEDDPPKPSTRLNAAGGADAGAGLKSPVLKISSELDWIALKALAKEPSARYENPAELVEDIERHRNREPVRASAPGPGIYLNRFFLKHRIASTVAAVAVLAIIATFLIARNLPRKPAPPPERPPIIVSNTRDSAVAPAGSLREAIENAESGDVIRFDPALAGQTIALVGGSLKIQNELLTLDAGNLSEPLTIDARENSGVFQIKKVAEGKVSTVNLSNFVITGGNEGGIFISYSTLNLDRCVITGNVNRSAGGGGIRSWGGVVSLENCVVSANIAPAGGGIYTSERSGTLRLVNTTVYGNSASAAGGGIATANYSRAELIHCTIAGNETQGRGGGIEISSGSVHLEATIVAANRAEKGESPDVVASTLGKITVRGTNLFTKSNVELESEGTLLSGDPQLAPLGDHGGPVPTMPPLPGSPAIDAGSGLGDNAEAATGLPANDARGVKRPIDGNGDGQALPDLGAVEFDPKRDR